MRRILSIVLPVLLLMTGCAGPGRTTDGQRNGDGGGHMTEGSGATPVQAGYVLSEPVYPEFPQRPQVPENLSGVSWEDYSQACERYADALAALRGDSAGLTEGYWRILNAFASKSAPLVLMEGTGENIIYSPLSLWSALALLAQCAEGDSRQQVLDAIEVERVDALQDQVEHIWRALYTDDGQSALVLANSIWLNQNLEGSYVQETLDTLAQKYYAGAYAVPMGTDAADRAVTNWVDRQTNGLIGGDSPAVQTRPDVLALLASSLYYKASWQDAFQQEGTVEDIFTDASRQEKQVDFMCRTEDANFIRRDGYQAARLGTCLGEMVFVLPDEGLSPESLLKEPDFLSRLEFYGDAATWGTVRWSVPKFDISSDLDLKTALVALGVTDLLDPDRADLSLLTDLDAYLSDARQLARVKVDEEGVEAAAVTILSVRDSAAMAQPTEVCVMDLDRPFLFVIRTEDVPLFVGIVNQV